MNSIRRNKLAIRHLILVLLSMYERTSKNKLLNAYNHSTDRCLRPTHTAQSADRLDVYNNSVDKPIMDRVRMINSE